MLDRCEFSLIRACRSLSERFSQDTSSRPRVSLAGLGSQNGKLLTAAEGAGLDLLLTTDKNLSYQQNLSGRKIAVRVLDLQQWPALRPHVSFVINALENIAPGSFAVIEIPRF